MFLVVSPESTPRGRLCWLPSSLCHRLPHIRRWQSLPLTSCSSCICESCYCLSLQLLQFSLHFQFWLLWSSPYLVIFRLVYPCSEHWPHWFMCRVCLYPFFHRSLYFPGQLCLSYSLLTLQLSWLSAGYIFGLPETHFWIFYTALLCVSVTSGFWNLSWIILVERMLLNFIVISSKKTYRH